MSNDPGFMLKTALLENLRSGRWRPGERLPAERQMCELHAVGRATVRRVLSDLKDLGLVTQAVGSGTFVAADIAGKLPQPALQEAGTSPSELMEARLIFEPGMIDLVVRNATAADFTRLEQYCRNADDAQSVEQFEYWDDAFHCGLAAATHNGLVVSVLSLMSKVRDHSEWGLLKKKTASAERRAAYQTEHWDILAQLRQRDVETARAALVAHLVHVRRNMFGY